MTIHATDFSPKQSIIATDDDARKLSPRATKFSAKVHNIEGLRLVIHPTGRKAWESNVKHPLSGRTKSKTHGTFPNISLDAAMRLHRAFYGQIRSGDDPEIAATQQKRRHQAQTILKTPIIRLGTALLENKLQRGELADDYNDRWSLRLIAAVIGKTSFLDFDEHICDKLSKAYPNTSDGWSKRDKVKKQITKIYNSLSSDVRGELRMDITHLLKQRFGTIQQRNRSERHIPSDQLTHFWVRLLTAPVPQIHKDAMVLALLTGERKQALLSIRLDQLQIKPGEPKILYVEGKRTHGDPNPSPNLIPITPMIGLLLTRLKKNAEQMKSLYLFPGQRGNTAKHLTNISKTLIDWLGSYGTGFTASPHNLRRTISNEASIAVGSIELADSHITHPTKHFKGSRVNYFSTKAIEFCQVRAETYAKAHQRIDDLILSNIHLLMKEGVLDENTDAYDPGETIGILAGLADAEASLYPPVYQESEKTRVMSPLASFCKGEFLSVDLVQRPLCAKAMQKSGIEGLLQDLSDLDFEKNIL